MLGSIGEELALAICLSGWAKPAVCEVGLGSMSSHSPTARKKVKTTTPRGLSGIKQAICRKKQANFSKLINNYSDVNGTKSQATLVSKYGDGCLGSYLM